MKTYLQKYGIYIGLLLVVTLFILGIQQKTDDSTVNIYSENTNNEQIVEKTYIYIDLKGAVVYPGVYKIEMNSRLFQVVALAGGLLPDADGNAINLSMILSDQTVIYVPMIGEEIPSSISDNTTNNALLVNINTATLEQLDALPGIGPVTAQAIIDYRENSSTFSVIEDLLNVSGIGESTFAEIKDLITC